MRESLAATESYAAGDRGDGGARPMIEVENLSLSYSGRVVLEGVSMALQSQRVTALIGPSGCGKTSLLSSLNRLTDLFSGCRVEGGIRIDGEDVRSLKCDVIALRRRVGMIFQRPNPFPLSIEQNIDLPLREHGVRSTTERRERIETALKDVGLWKEVHDRLNKPAQHLSGGQQQRLCIARALALQPEVLLLDEPCGSLDPLSTAMIEDRILELGERLTVVIVTHNLNQARRIADDVGFFWTQDGVGRLTEFGPTAQVFDAPRDPLTEAYVTGRTG